MSTQAGPFSQSFYREQCDLKGLGFPSLDAFIVGFFEHMFLNVEANNLLAMLATWQAADVSDTDQFKGDFAKALGSIKAKAFVMPCRTDLNFPHEDSEVDPVDSQCLLKVIPSIWEHAAGALGINKRDASFIDNCLRELLTR